MADCTEFVPLDSFSRVFPLPFRVATIIVLAVWAWSANLHVLALAKIDVPALINYPPRSSSTQPSLHLSTYRVATFLTTPLIAFLVFFWFVTRGDDVDQLILGWHRVPGLCILALAIALILPIRSLSVTGRFRLLQTFRRIAIGGLAPDNQGKFGDILCADVLTSYSRVLADIYVMIFMVFENGEVSTAMPRRACALGGVHMYLAVPSLIRLSQCLIEFRRTRKGLARGTLNRASAGWGGQHLANALKYSSAFPVIGFGLMHAHSMDDEWRASAFHLWYWHHLQIYAALLNSLYSFYWDVARDWDLPLFDDMYHSLIPHRDGHAPSGPLSVLGKVFLPTSVHEAREPSVPFGLRRVRHFHKPSVYYSAIVLDMVLRLTWIARLGSSMERYSSLEAGIFVLQALEVGRRWMWIFLRVETESVRKRRGSTPRVSLIGEI